MKPALALPVMLLLAAAMPLAGASQSACLEPAALVDAFACGVAGGAGSGRCSENGTAMNGAYVSAATSDRDYYAGANHSCAGAHSGGTGYENRRVDLDLRTTGSDGVGVAEGVHWTSASSQSPAGPSYTCTLQVTSRVAQPCSERTSPPAPPLLLP